MARHRGVYRPAPAVPIDQAFMDRLQAAGRVTLCSRLRDKVREVLVDHNSLERRRRVARRAAGLSNPRHRPRGDNHSLAVGLILIFIEAGGMPKSTWAKGARNTVDADVADFLRVAWDAIADPRTTQDGFARLVRGAWFDTQAVRRRARREYIERISLAWRSEDDGT